MAVTYNNIPVAYVDPNFLQQLDALKDQSRRIYTSTLLGNDTTSGCSDDSSSQRKWQIPSPGDWDLNLFDIGGISSAYDRVTANNVYIRALTKGPQVGALDLAPEGEGRVSDCIAMKTQIDHLAVQERAFRLRHASSIRCKIHAATRRRGHSTWNDAVGVDATLADLGAGIEPGPNDIAGPVGGVFTTMVRYILTIIRGGYNEGSVDIIRPATVVTTLSDGSVIAEPS